MRLGIQRLDLVEALCCVTEFDRRQTARRFLEGLSTDELQYIAAYLGARLLDPELGIAEATRERMAYQIEQYESQRGRSGVAFSRMETASSRMPAMAANVAHKMILLLEYLSMNALGRERKAWSVEAGSA